MAGLAAVLGALVMWAVSQVGGSSELLAMGEPIVNAAEELADAEEELLTNLDILRTRSVLSGEVVDYESVSCWFSYPDGDDEPGDHVRCGPVAFADSEEGTHWIQLPVLFSETDEGTRASIGSFQSRRTWASEDEELRRPDGRKAPATEGIDLERPPVPVVDDDAPEVVFVFPGDLMVDLAEPEDGRLNGLGHKYEIEGHGTADRVLLSDEQVAQPAIFGAPEGQRWLLFGVEGVDTDTGAHLLAREVTYSIEIDGSARPLEPDVSTTSQLTMATLATLVPEDAEDIAFVVADEVLEYRWSFSSGARSEDAPEVLYRDPATRVADGGEQSVPYTVSDNFPLPPDYDFPPLPEIPEIPDYEFEPLPEIPDFEFEPLPEVPEIPDYEPEPLPEIPELDLEPLSSASDWPRVPDPLGLEPAAFAPVVMTGEEQEQLTISFDEARLHYGVRSITALGSPELHTAAGPDRALLYLTGLEARWNSVLAYDAIATESISLTLDDGTEVEPLPVTVGSYEYMALMDVDDPLEAIPHIEGFGQLPVWDVPAGIEHATLHIAPESTEDALADVEYHDTMEFTLEFG